MATIHAKRVTLMPKDIHLVLSILNITRSLNVDYLGPSDKHQDFNIRTTRNTKELGQKYWEAQKAQDQAKHECAMKKARQLEALKDRRKSRK